MQVGYKDKIINKNLWNKRKIGMLKCPVCGREIREAKYAGARIEVGRVRYYFYSMDCKNEILHNAEKYILDEKYGEIARWNKSYFARFLKTN